MKLKKSCPIELVRQLRAKSAEGKRVTPEALLKFLVKTDAITQWKAEELRAVLLGPRAVTPASGGDEILDLAPLPELEEERRPSRSKPPVDVSEPPPGPLAPPRRSGDDEPLFSSKAAKLDEPSLESLPADAGADGNTPGLYKLGGGKKGKGKGKKTKRTAGGRNQWDSPLLLFGGGAVVVLLVVGLLLYYLLFRETADAVLADADKLFRGEAYSQAIPRFEEFLTRFPSHRDASRAKVQLEITKLWQAVAGMSDPGAALATAKAVIAEIEDEPAFAASGGSGEGLSEAKQDLSKLLVDIGKGLVEAGEKSTDQAKTQEIIKQIEEVLALSANTKYVPEKFRNGPELAAMEESLGVIKSRQERDARLATTLEKMKAAIASGNTADAFAARLTLLSEYPRWPTTKRSRRRSREASAAEQAQVKFTAEERAAETVWPERAVVAELALAERRDGNGAPLRGRTAGDASGAPVVVRVDGALYGMRSGDGAMLWRRFAGMGAMAAPLSLSGGDIVAADWQAGELWRSNAAMGKVVWRLPLGERVAGVVPAGSRCWPRASQATCSSSIRPPAPWWAACSLSSRSALRRPSTIAVTAFTSSPNTRSCTRCPARTTRASASTILATLPAPSQSPPCRR